MSFVFGCVCVCKINSSFHQNQCYSNESRNRIHTLGKEIVEILGNERVEKTKLLFPHLHAEQNTLKTDLILWVQNFYEPKLFAINKRRRHGFIYFQCI